MAAESEYSFKVHNNTRTKMTKLLVSEDKKDWDTSIFIKVLQ
ncbi:MAG: hypothetical protein ACXV74_10850 [Methylobacter sp.]